MRDLLAQSFNLLNLSNLFNLFNLFNPATQEVVFLRLEKPK
jgi:hypothetical protein